MGFFKKYPAFASLVTVFVLLFIAGLVFIFLSWSSLGKAQKSYEQAESSYKAALGLNPAATAQNVETSEKNVQALAAALQVQVDDTKGRVPTFISKDVPKTEADMLFQLEAFKEQFTKDAAEIEPQGAEKGAVGMTLPKDFEFGFSRFLSTGTPPPAKYIPEVFEQKEILSYILRKLYDSRPFSLVQIQREVVVEDVAPAQPQPGNNKQAKQNAGKGNNDEFEIGALSARVPGAVETVAFRLVFTGYTQSLRDFLKSLEEFELPLVVRSVEVQPAEKKATASSTPSRASSPFDLFDTGGAAGPTEEQKAAAKEPIVEENVSQFTVVVEYIKVLVEAPSDVAALENATSSQNPQ